VPGTRKRGRGLKIEDCNWLQVEEYLQRDDRLVIPLGSIEQHAYLSLGVDRILSQRVSEEAADPLGVLVLPSLPYGLTPYFAAYPGSPTLRVETYRAVLRDLLDSLAGQGFRRFLFVNGHGGNDAGREAVEQWQTEHPACRAHWHNWWAGARTRAVVDSIDPDASHASWFENFPWTRLEGVDLPRGKKAMADISRMRELDPRAVRELLGDGSLGGLYERPDDDVLRVWEAGVAELRELIEHGW
jgi:creatinine amidohydrolase